LKDYWALAFVEKNIDFEKGDYLEHLLDLCAKQCPDFARMLLMI